MRKKEEEAKCTELNEGTKTVHVESMSSDESLNLNDVMREVRQSVKRNKRRAQQAMLTIRYTTKFVTIIVINYIIYNTDIYIILLIALYKIYIKVIDM